MRFGLGELSMSSAQCARTEQRLYTLFVTIAVLPGKIPIVDYVLRRNSITYGDSGFYFPQRG